MALVCLGPGGPAAAVAWLLCCPLLRGTAGLRRCGAALCIRNKIVTLLRLPWSAASTGGQGVGMYRDG